MAHPVIYLHATAPSKPAPGEPCNACGVCCAWQPCPLGVLVSGRRQGPCSALQWQAEGGRYRCAMVMDPKSVWPALPSWLQPGAKRLARRWIASGSGCDSSLEVEAG